MVYSQPRNVFRYLNAIKSNPRSPQSTTCGSGGRRASVAPLALENTAMANHPVSTRATRFAIKIVLLSLPNALYRRASITRSRNDMVIDPSFPIATACKYHIGGERLHLEISLLSIRLTPGQQDILRAPRTKIKRVDGGNEFAVILHLICDSTVGVPRFARRNALGRTLCSNVR